eukprot:656563-Amphidinium_carterae.1
MTKDNVASHGHDTDVEGATPVSALRRFMTSTQQHERPCDTVLASPCVAASSAAWVVRRPIARARSLPLTHPVMYTFYRGHLD